VSGAGPAPPGGGTSRTRLGFFAVAAAGTAAALGVAFAGLPAFGSHLSAYAALLDRLSVPARHATDAITAVSFDFRGVDTLFEEFVLFASVTGISVLLRPLANEIRGLPEDEAPDRRIPAPSPTVGLFGVLLSPTLVLFGVETVTHGQISPGGGFQGGVVLASALFVIYLVTDYRTVERYQPGALIEGAEGVGAGGYVLVGVVGLLAGAAYLTNVVPLGHPGNVVSAGTIPILNAVVGVEVAGGFVLLVSEFLDQLAVIRGQHP
jgi:multicomponent Na+:H+ antiporter subunit B